LPAFNIRATPLMMKRIVVCADGTWNIRDQLDKATGKRRPSNVTKVARAVLPNDGSVEQVVFYHEGLGTSGGLDTYTGGAFGDGIERNIRDLYRSILYNYVPGDELFFFGFSRGAFTVRTLAGFMHLVGLLRKDDDYWLPEIYDCYSQGRRPGSAEWTQAFRGVEEAPLPCPPIKLIAVWDTVGALGPPGVIGQLFNRRRYQYHDVALNPTILNAYQALAIDERRRPFAPSVWDRPAGWTGTLEQAWFAGTHCNVGGGETPDGLANEALHWIVEKAEGLGLSFDCDYLNYYRNCYNSTLHDSMTVLYRVMEPLVRHIGAHGAEERLHQSALDRRKLASCAYSAPNVDAYLQRNPNAPCYVTTRVPCGTPC
jgi:uncharacterized protein (DUF2235 family)